MGIVEFFKKLIKGRKGVTYIEVMMAVSILAISLTYISVDSRYSSQAIYELHQKDKMLYTAQDVIERYKLDFVGGSKTVEGYSVNINVINDPEQDPNLTGYLTRVAVTVHPLEGDTGIGDLVVYSYVFTPIMEPPATPTNLIATPSADGVVLNWDIAALAETYTVKRSITQGGPYAEIATGVGEITYTDTTAAYMTTYYYVVSAKNVYGESANSNEASTEIIVNSITLDAVEDSYVRYGQNAGINYNTDRILYSKTSTTRNTYKSYIKFDLSSISGNIVDAKLQLYGYNSTSSANMNIDVYKLFDIYTTDNWAESTITGTNAPAIGGLLSTGVINGTPNTLETDVRSYCLDEIAVSGNKIATFVISSASSDLATFESKDKIGGTQPPRLVIGWTELPPPAQPQNLKGIPGNNQAILNWDTVVGAESYKVKRSTVNGGPYTTVATSLTPSYTNIGLTNGTTYYYVVAAVNGNGESINSNQVAVIPNKVTTIMRSPNADAYVREGIYANINYGSAQTIDVENDAGGTDDRKIGYMRFDLSDLRGEVITAKLKLYGSNIEDTTVVDLNCYEVSNNTWEELTINANNDPGIGNEIGTVKVDDMDSIKEIDISGYVKTKMASDKIVTIGLQGEGAAKLLSFYSNDKQNVLEAYKPKLEIYKTLLVPLAPTSVTAVPDDAKITLSWEASAETDSYNIKRSATSGGPYTTVASGITGTSYINTGLTNGINYYYVITAVNGAGESINSEQVNAVPNPTITQEFTPVADARVESYYPNSNFGTQSYGMVANNGSNNKATYYKFDLTGYTYNSVVSAKLRIYGASNYPSYKVNAHGTSTVWTEGGITWANKPALQDVAGSLFVNEAPGGYYEIDVTNYIATQMSLSNLVSLGLYTDIVSSYDATFNTKEAGAADNPRLVVKMVQGVPKQPKNLTAVGGNKSVNLSWNAADGATSYTVKRGTASGTYTTNFTGITGTAYSDISVSNGNTYYYVVVGVNTNGQSIDSNEACAMPDRIVASVTIQPIEDTYVRDGSYEGTNYGSETVINAYNSGVPNSGNNRETYIQFDLSSITSAPTSATLYLTGANITNSKKVVTVYIYQATSDSWNEHTTTYNTGNPGQGAYIGSIAVKTYATQSINVTSFIQSQWAGDKKVSFCIKAYTTGFVTSFSSKEGSDAPLLQVTQ